MLPMIVGILCLFVAYGRWRLAPLSASRLSARLSLSIRIGADDHLARGHQGSKSESLAKQSSAKARDSAMTTLEGLGAED